MRPTPDSSLQIDACEGWCAAIVLVLATLLVGPLIGISGQPLDCFLEFHTIDLKVDPIRPSQNGLGCRRSSAGTIATGRLARSTRSGEGSGDG